MSGLPRDVLKWIQGLNLSWQIKTPKWDLSNGYLIAEIFSCYYNQEIRLHCFTNQNSLVHKEYNWFFIKEFLKAKNLYIPQDYMEGTTHCKEGAAALLLVYLYELLTNRKVQKVPPELETDYTDHAYQIKLPMHARSTATKAVKNNLRLTEILASPDQTSLQIKCQKIIEDHNIDRQQERLQVPKRFAIKPTIGERCLRRSPPLKKKSDDEEEEEDKELSEKNTDVDSKQQSVRSQPLSPETDENLSEVQVKQTDKSAFYGMPIHGF